MDRRVEMMETEMKKSRVRSSKDRRFAFSPMSYPRESMNFQTWKQRHEEMVREGEQNRLAKELRDSRKRRRSGRASALAWESKRISVRLLNLLRSLTKSDQERRRRRVMKLVSQSRSSKPRAPRPGSGASPSHRQSAGGTNLTPGSRDEAGRE